MFFAGVDAASIQTYLALKIEQDAALRPTPRKAVKQEQAPHKGRTAATVAFAHFAASLTTQKKKASTTTTYTTTSTLFDTTATSTFPTMNTSLTSMAAASAVILAKKKRDADRPSVTYKNAVLASSFFGFSFPANFDPTIAHTANKKQAVSLPTEPAAVEEDEAFAEVAAQDEEEEFEVVPTLKQSVCLDFQQQDSGVATN
jgi:hypothetical protein